MAEDERERAESARHWQLRRERARYETERAERQYRACEPENGLVARELGAAMGEGAEGPGSGRDGVRAVATDGPRPTYCRG